MRLSGLQKEVLSLYKTCLRASVLKDKALNIPIRLGKTKPSSDSSSMVYYVQSRFRNDAATIKRSNFQLIEHSLRLGKRQLSNLNKPNVSLKP